MVLLLYNLVSHLMEALRPMMRKGVHGGAVGVGVGDLVLERGPFAGDLGNLAQ